MHRDKFLSLPVHCTSSSRTDANPPGNPEIIPGSVTSIVGHK